MRNFFVLVWLNQINVFSAKLRSNPSSIYFFPAKYPLFFGDDFLLVNHILLLGIKVLYFNFIHKNVKRVCPPFRGSLLGLGVFTTLNFTLPGKEAH